MTAQLLSPKLGSFRKSTFPVQPESIPRPFDKILAMAEDRSLSTRVPNLSSTRTCREWTPIARCTRRAEEQPEEFWGELAEKELFWFEKWSKVFEWNPPFAKWFVGGKTNVSYNCLDRHLATHRKNKVAILWEGEPGDQRIITYQELHRLVCRFANVLKVARLQSRRPRHHLHAAWSRSCPSRMLACARLGIIHSVVFGGFSAEALKARIQDLEAPGGDHRRRRLAPRQGSEAEGRRG